MKRSLPIGFLVISGLLITFVHASNLRKSFYGWQSIPQTCRNQRHQILMLRSQTPVTFKTDQGCRVESGVWQDFYTQNKLLYAKDVSLDHVVSLKYAYEHGAKSWPKNKRKQFYNDQDNLVMTNVATNSKKNFYAPDQWLPENHMVRCRYVQKWAYIAQKYQLDIEQSLEDLVEDTMQGCTPGETRTPDHLVRSQALYPTELRAQ